MKNLLKKLTKEKAPGPSPSFSEVHIAKAIELIAERPIGRISLSRKLALGEGATRTLIDRLKDYGLITVSKAGCFFTKEGQKFWKFLHLSFPKKILLEKSELTLGSFNVAILIKERGDRVRLGMEQRDAALVVGAKGATTLIFRNGKLKFPSENRDIAKDFPRAYEKLYSMQPKENDAVVIGSADTLPKAEYGALAAALSLLMND